MADQPARQDPNRFPAMIAHTGTAGTAETERIVSAQGGMFTQSRPFMTILDEASGTVSYVGEALTGTSGTATTWRIKRLVIDTSSGTVTTTDWADGNDNFDNVWNNRASLSYS